MANNKDFKVKNGIQPTVYHEAVGTVVSSIEETGPVGVFSTDLYSGNSSTQTITNDIDLSGDGGLVWIKTRNSTQSNNLVDTERGDQWRLITNANQGQIADSDFGTFLSNGFSLDGANQMNLTGNDHVSWTFKKEPNFFDVVTYTGDGNSGQTINHNLGSVPAFMIVKRTDSTGNWTCYHHSLNGGSSPESYRINLNQTGSSAGPNASYWNNTAPTSTQFTVGSDLNITSATFVVYLFAHDTSADSMIKCIGYTGDGGSAHNIDLGWKPQWLLFKNASNSGTPTNWQIYDAERGIPDGTGDLYLRPNDTSADSSVSYIDLTDTGFTLTNNSVQINQSGDAYICVAIREAVSTSVRTLDLSTGSVFDYTPTSDVQVTVSNPAASGTVSQATLLLSAEDAAGVTGTFDTTTWSGNGSTQTITNNVDLANDGGMVWIKQRNTNQDHVITDTERGAGYRLKSNGTQAQDYDLARLSSFNSDGFSIGNNTTVNNSSGTYVGWTFKKAAKFFDVVTYTGDGVAGRTVSHNLGTTVGTLIIKRTDTTGEWIVYHKDISSINNVLFLNSTSGEFAYSSFNSTAPTSTEFTLGTRADVNASGGTYVAYLFAHDTSADSIIKCGSVTYTTGATVDLGFEPQWVLMKPSSRSGNWILNDSVRGMPNGSRGPRLDADTSGAEIANGTVVYPTSTGFTMPSSLYDNPTDLVYIAIRNPYIPTITYDTNLEWSGGTAPAAPAVGETDVITINTRDGGTTYQAIQAIDGAS